MTDVEKRAPIRTKWIVAPDRAAGDSLRARLPAPHEWAVVTPRVSEYAPDLPGAVVTDYLVADWPDDAPLAELRRRDDVILLLEDRMKAAPR